MKLRKFAVDMDYHFLELGKVTSGRFKLSEFIDLDINEFSHVWKNTLLNELD